MTIEQLTEILTQQNVIVRDLNHMVEGLVDQVDEIEARLSDLENPLGEMDGQMPIFKDPK